jgi:hypothetical protein
MNIKSNINIIKTKRSGYASVALVVFVVIGVTLTTAATTIILINSLATNKMQQGMVAYDVAENGMENGIIRFLRDPVNYTGETVNADNGTATILVSADKNSITSVGVSGNYRRKIETQIDYTNDFKIISWKEVY